MTKLEVSSSIAKIFFCSGNAFPAMVARKRKGQAFIEGSNGCEHPSVIEVDSCCCERALILQKTVYNTNLLDAGKDKHISDHATL